MEWQQFTRLTSRNSGFQAADLLKVNLLYFELLQVTICQTPVIRTDRSILTLCDFLIEQLHLNDFYIIISLSSGAANDVV